MRHLETVIERWPLASAFTIARGSKTEAAVIVVSIRDGAFCGRGECVPYARYGETLEAVAAAIGALAGPIAEGLDRAGLAAAMPPGAARNAIDCALWDLEAKRAGVTVAELAGLAEPRPLDTAFTISLGTPDAMAAAARAATGRPLLKLKLGGAGDPERIAAVRAAVPAARLIVDGNEGWTLGQFAQNMAACSTAGVLLVEQPFPAASDDALAGLPHPVPICADESLHVGGDLERLRGRYEAVNIKLDKTGGLTEALALGDAARRAGFTVMVGCMVATSLSMAPAVLVAQGADFVDLDGPLLLAADRADGIVYRGGTLMPPSPALWG